MSATRAILKLAAERRAGIIAGITNAGRPLQAFEIRETPEVVKLKMPTKALDQAVYRMQLSGKLIPDGNRGARTYWPAGVRLPAQHNGAELLPAVTTHKSNGALPTVIVTRQKNGHLRLEVRGNLVVEFAAI